MRYFAMIDGRRTGPWELWQLPEAGVTPETYVWCKGMADWRKAEEVADICRYFRQHLAGIEPEGSPYARREESAESVKTPSTDNASEEGLPTRFSGFGFPTPPSPEGLFEPADLTKPPVSMLVPAILATLFCFPVTGFVGIYYAVATRRLWQAAESAGDGKSAPTAIKDTESGHASDRDTLRREAYDASRAARMWTGVTFFLGLIFWAFVFRFNS